MRNNDEDNANNGGNEDLRAETPLHRRRNGTNSDDDDQNENENENGTQHSGTFPRTTTSSTPIRISHNSDPTEMDVDPNHLPPPSVSSAGPLSSLSTERRRQILMRILYERFLQTRHQRTRTMADIQSQSQSQNQAESNNTIAARRLPLRFLDEHNILSHREEVVCRFCLEEASCSMRHNPQDESTDQALALAEGSLMADDRFIAPCACTGSSEYVHVKCLRTWQLTQLLGRRRHQRRRPPPITICQVCTIPYSLRPPVLKPHLIQQGTLLVYAATPNTATTTSTSTSTASSNTNTTFDQTIVLMLTAASPSSSGTHHPPPMGIILNKQQQQQLHPETATSTDDTTTTTATTTTTTTNATDADTAVKDMRIRHGGPVCGGRFGVTKFVLVRVLQNKDVMEVDDDSSPFTITEEEGSCVVAAPTTNDATNDSLCSPQSLYYWRQLSRQIAVLFRRKHVEEEQGQIAATTNTADELALLERGQLQEHGITNGNKNNNNSSSSSSSNHQLSFVAFQGYCKWSKDQLESELLSGSWGIVKKKETRSTTSPRTAHDGLDTSDHSTIPPCVLDLLSESSSSSNTAATTDCWHELIAASNSGETSDGDTSTSTSTSTTTLRMYTSQQEGGNALLPPIDWFDYPLEEQE